MYLESRESVSGTLIVTLSPLIDLMNRSCCTRRPGYHPISPNSCPSIGTFAETHAEPNAISQIGHPICCYPFLGDSSLDKYHLIRFEARRIGHSELSRSNTHVVICDSRGERHC